VHSERPPQSERGERDESDREKSRLERILPELIKRILEAGYEKITDTPENVREFVREMKLPKEVLALIIAQIDETKNGLYRVVSKEIRDFLEQTNLAEELTKALTTVSFEIKTEVRFIPNDARPGTPPKPDIRSKVAVKRDRRTTPSEPPQTPETPPPPANDDNDDDEKEQT
jgi:hypothetical protein